YYNRFNFYYGWESGPNYRYDRGNYYNVFRVYNPDRSDYYWVTVEQRIRKHSIGATVTAFVGVKYRITPRISLSFESAATAFYQWTKKRQSIQSDHMDVVSSEDTSHQFGGNIQYLRFITLNYHFKHY
ncbi:MAG: hypothetical protein IT269_03505, partial [Saprospiraceae bacterium]|nr:hypothetical protein [Saprospiraceae bacterium]